MLIHSHENILQVETNVPNDLSFPKKRSGIVLSLNTQLCKALGERVGDMLR